ncbi:reverse transcriptase domain-containing protein [Tanacetum coccineum]
MFSQTLGGAAQNYFDDLDPKSVDSFEELSQKFMEEFSQQKRYAKDPTEIHDIKRRQNEGLQAFMDWFKSKSSHIKGVPPVLRISAFIHGHDHPKLAKKLNDKIPKTMDEMFERVRAFIRGEVAVGSAEMMRPSQGDKGYVRPTWSGVPEKARSIGDPREAQRNIGVYTLYHRKDTFTLLIKTSKEILAIESVSFPEPPPLIETPKKQNLNKFCDYHRDKGKEGCEGHKHDKGRRKPQEIFQRRKSEGSLWTVEVHQKSSMNTASETLISTSGQGSEGRTGMRSLRAVSSTIHSMIKFPTNQGVVTMETSRETLRECKHLERVQGSWKETRSESTAVLRLVMEHQSKIYPLAKPVVHKRRPVAPEGRLALKERVFRWLGEGLIRKDMYPFPEEGEELASLMGYPYKCFLRILKEYSQIRMAEDDEEKTSKRTWLDEQSRRSPPKEKKETGNIVNIGHPKRRRRSNAMSMAKKQDNKLCAIGREGRNPDTCFLCELTSTRWKLKAVVKKFFGQGEQAERTPYANEGGTLTLSKKLQVKSTPVPRAWWLYLGKDTIEEGSGVGIILVSPEKKMHSYAIRLKFNASNHVMDCEALLAGLAASANQDMKDLHVFIDSLTLVAQVEGNHTPVTEHERKYKE